MHGLTYSGWNTVPTYLHEVLTISVLPLPSWPDAERWGRLSRANNGLEVLPYDAQPNAYELTRRECGQEKTQAWPKNETWSDPRRRAEKKELWFECLPQAQRGKRSDGTGHLGDSLLLQCAYTPTRAASKATQSTEAKKRQARSSKGIRGRGGEP